MKTLIQILFHRMTSWWQERWHLSLELLALRHQVEVMRRSGKRPRFSSSDRCFWLILSRLWSRWSHVLEIMQSDTVRRWRRQGIRHHLRWRRGRKRPGRPPIPAETRNLIREISRDNRLWGAPRIHGELAKLGINISRTTVAKYMVRRLYPPSPTWRTFIRNQTPEFFSVAVSAALSGRFRAVSARVVRALRRWLSWCVSGWLYRSGWRHATSLTERHDSLSVPVALSLDIADHGLVCGRSPPGSRPSSPEPLFDADLPIDVGMSDVHLKSAVPPGCAISASLLLTPQEIGRVQRTDISEQAAA